MFTKYFTAFSVLFCTVTMAFANPLEDGFLNPPDSAKPQTWWHWMNGNVTKEGITADLEAMKRVGIGGATIVNADCGIPRGNATFMGPEWQDDFKFAVQEANRLGLHLCLENCAGWSSSGGPWNTVTNSMKRLVTSEVHIIGPTNFSAVLPQPKTVLNFYRDVAVLAFPAPKATARIDNLNAKAGFSGKAVLSDAPADFSSKGAIQCKDIRDLSAKLSSDGRLTWRVPPGKWVVLRVGYTSTGVKNHPAPLEGTGLECDKFSKAALDAHWNGFMQKELDEIGPLAGTTLNASLIDSYEVGGQNWSEDFRKEFQTRRGYDPLKFLPTFTGRVVDNPAVSERFLWDVRRTIADLFAENYYGHFTELCHEHGLESDFEPYTGPFESLQSGASADVPMGEFWAGSQSEASIKLASSVGHIYGQRVIGAESFTAAPSATHGRWLDDPYSLKALGDLVFCQGINRYVYHRFAMQPWTNRWPGMTMGPWGSHFDRTSTWWEQGREWQRYIARCQFMLQQGRFIADAAYFDGQSAPVETRVDRDQFALPMGYDYDQINADVLMHHATVANGKLVLDSGMSYNVLALPPEDRNMTPELLKQLRHLVSDGLTVVGVPPLDSPSLQDYPKCDKQVKELTGELWGNCDGVAIQEHLYGKGRIVWGKSLAEFFAKQNVKPDFEFQGASADPHLTYIHRVAGAVDIYFVSNQRDEFVSTECTFRVSGKIPELWHPDTGIIEPAPVWNASNGRTTVRLDFDPAGSVFVIFHQAVNGADHVITADSDMALDSSRTPQLKIQRAIYAAADGAREVDVTAKLSKLAQHGPLVMGADNDTLGRDPAMFQAKELRVDYTLDGQPGHVIVPEGGTLRLPPDPYPSMAPAWSVCLAANGSPVVKVWEDGSVTLHTADGKVVSVDATNVPAPRVITGPWNLSFPPDWGAPPSVVLNKLISWTEHTNSGVRYFSGTAGYEKGVEIPAEMFGPGREIWLDLGEVKNFAEVSLNGKSFPVLWKPPFRLNVTGAAQAGANKLEIKVTNLWPNRLIGDEQLPDDREWSGKRLKEWPQWVLDGKPSPTGRFTFTTWHHWTKNDALLKSGLLGPVKLESVTIIPANAASAQ